MGGIVRAVTGLVGDLFGGDQPTINIPPAPQVTEPTPIPQPDDAQVLAAKQRSIAAQMQQTGRRASVLTQDPMPGEGKLGG